MSDWYYAKNGQQHGPVSKEGLRIMIRDGSLKPESDLVWNSSMPDWLPAADVPELSDMNGGDVAPPHEAVSQPFAYDLGTGPIREIEPGSEQIIPTACVKRGWDLTVRHIGPVLVTTVIFVAVSIGLNQLLMMLDTALGWHPTGDFFKNESDDAVSYSYYVGTNNQLSLPSSILSSLGGVFLMLGATRMGLLIVSGKDFEIGMIFSGGRWLLKGFIAHVLYWLMVVCGLILLIVPGIYLAIRFGMYQNAIVDRNMGVIDAFKYSSELTRNNRLQLFVVALFTIGIVIAGCLAFIVGLLFAYPMILLMWIVAYRWLQFGGRAVLDDPSTGKPMLSELPD